MGLSCHSTDEHTEAQKAVLLAWALVEWKAELELQAQGSSHCSSSTCCCGDAWLSCGQEQPRWLQCEQFGGRGEKNPCHLHLCQGCSGSWESSLAWPPAPCSPQLAHFRSRGCWNQASMHGFYGISAERWRGTYPGAFLTGIIFFLSLFQSSHLKVQAQVSIFFP